MSNLSYCYVLMAVFNRCICNNKKVQTIKTKQQVQTVTIIFIQYKLLVTSFIDSNCIQKIIDRHYAFGRRPHVT